MLINQIVNAILVGFPQTVLLDHLEIHYSSHPYTTWKFATLYPQCHPPGISSNQFHGSGMDIFSLLEPHIPIFSSGQSASLYVPSRKIMCELIQATSILPAQIPGQTPCEQLSLANVPPPVPTMTVKWPAAQSISPIYRNIIVAIFS